MEEFFPSSFTLHQSIGTLITKCTVFMWHYHSYMSTIFINGHLMVMSKNYIKRKRKYHCLLLAAYFETKSDSYLSGLRYIRPMFCSEHITSEYPTAFNVYRLTAYTQQCFIPRNLQLRNIS